MQGVSVLYNTYWVRFNHKGFSYEDAVKNTLAMFSAAGEAGVQRIVHLSITNPSAHSPLEYFRRKAELESALRESGLPFSILRPAVLFGREDILINNIAWVLRRFPAFAVFGDGEYRLQPIYVGDVAALAVEEGEKAENRVVDAIGPETYTYRGLVETIGRAIGRPRPIVSVPPWLGYLAGRALGTLMHDVLITRDEIEGLVGELLYVDSPAAGSTGLAD